MPALVTTIVQVGARLPCRKVAATSVLSALVAACGAPATPVPEGFSFPTWNTANGGAAALLEGSLAERGGCFYVHAAAPSTADYLIVWPDTLHLTLVEGSPVITNGAGFALRVGDPVSLGGGELTPSLVPAGAARCDRTSVWGVSEIVGVPR